MSSDRATLWPRNSPDLKSGGLQNLVNYARKGLPKTNWRRCTLMSCASASN